MIEKITNLSPLRISEVENFVDFLTEKESNQKEPETGMVNLRDLSITAVEAAGQRAALSSFAEDWERPEMEVYDKV